MSLPKPPLASSAPRVGIGSVVLAGLILAFIARSELWQERQSTLNAWRQYLVLGSLGMLICGAWVYWAAETTTAINIALIYAASPVLITLGAVIGLRESFSWRQSLGLSLLCWAFCTSLSKASGQHCHKSFGSSVMASWSLPWSPGPPMLYCLRSGQAP